VAGQERTGIDQPPEGSPGNAGQSWQDEILRLSEDRFRSLFGGVKNCAVILLDTEGRIVSWNARAEQIKGYQAQEILGRHFSCFYPAEDVARGKPEQELAAAREQGEIADEGWRIRRDGSRYYATVLIIALRDEAGNLRGYSKVTRDLTDRKTEASLRSVLDNVIDGVITINERCEIDSFNPAAARIFGYLASEVIGQNVKMLMPEPYHGEHDGYVGNYLRSGQAKIIGIGREVVGQRKDGTTFPMDLAVSEFQLGGRRFFTGIVRDITERKRLEQELRQRLAELAEADRRKDVFLATLAHELRNPLAPIVNAVQILDQANVSLDDLQWARGVIGRQVDQLVHLIDDLLDIARITRGKVELRKTEVDLATVVESAVESSRPWVDRARNTLTVTFPPEPIRLHADPTRLAQILLNLLNNAAKFTPPGGDIHLDVEKDADAAVLIRVRDNGIGIPGDMLHRVFEMFTQVDSPLEYSQGGLGIGLSLVRGLIELHGGTVEAHSDGPGKGSEFVVRLPLSEDKQQSQAVGVVSGPWAEGASGRRIMVIDDNKDAADLMARLLKTAGNEVCIAYDGPSAIHELAAFGPDLVFCDIGMPGMNGYDVARKIRENPRFANLFLVALTGWGQEEDHRHSQEAGFNAHLVKPVRLDVLQRLWTEHQPVKAPL
jgi:PAS domain S-box-containing protein